MPKMNFTVRSLEAIQPPPSGRVEYWDSSTNGSFGVRVSASGQKTWVVMYRSNGRLRRFTIGNYERLPLADSRAIAKEVLYRATKGEDPASEKAGQRQSETFQELAREYMDRHAKVNKRSWKEDERMLAKNVIPHWGTLKANKIRRKDVIALLDLHVTRGAPVLANRVLALVRKTFNFGLQRDIVDYNPCQAVQRPTDEKLRQGQRVLTFEEIRKVWSSIEEEPHMIAAIFKLRLLTAQRGSEIRSMKWSDLDFETSWWTIPPERTKNKLQHRVPLTKETVSILNGIKQHGKISPFVFPSPREKCGHINAIQKAFCRIRTKSGVLFTDRDFRRTAASHLTGQLGIPRLVVSRILNHVETGITRVYDRHSYDLEKRNALAKWNHLVINFLSQPNPTARDPVKLGSFNLALAE